jgi:hypothetical protein
MPIPQLSSLLLNRRGLPALGPTVLKWLDFVETESQFTVLCTALRGIPSEWVDWAEDSTSKAIARGVSVTEPLSYRLAVLLNGIINLQECKYLVDAMENALRVEALEYSRIVGIEISDVLYSVPDHAKFRPLPSTIPNLVMSCTFYQLSELFARNWNGVRLVSKAGKPMVSGFRSVFQSKKSCRDVNRFRKAMKTARNCRNDVAHSRRLFAYADVEIVYKAMGDWFDALHLDICSRVASYRGMRPNFLDGLV